MTTLFTNPLNITAMADNANNNSRIVNHWSLIAFARKFGPKMQVGSFTNSETGDKFNSCIFSDGDKRTFVAFSSKMGELTPKEIASMKDELQVVELDSGNYSLCKQGSGSWEDVDLGF